MFYKWSERPLSNSPPKWFLRRETTGDENEENNNFVLADKVLSIEMVLTFE